MTDFEDRKSLLRKIEEQRDTRAILYITGDRQGLETRIGQDVIDLFVDHLDELGPVHKLSLILYTSGGSTSAAWNLVNLLHMFCDDFEVIALGKCMSAGTLISLGADRIVMTKQATLGPIDPSIQHPLGPPIPGASPDARADVSVEAVNGYLDAVKESGRGKDVQAKALLDLSDKVHPLVLGQIFRSRQQIRDLAQRLIVKHTRESDKAKQVIDFLCSESGSHDYTINRREAKVLGLNIEKCTPELYSILKELRASYSSQMELRLPFEPGSIATIGQATSYTFTRAVIESAAHGAHHFISEGNVEATEISHSQPDGFTMRQVAVKDHRGFDGWRKVA